MMSSLFNVIGLLHSEHTGTVDGNESHYIYREAMHILLYMLYIVDNFGRSV